MKKVILNKCFGGFDVSFEAYKLYAKKKGMNVYKYVAHFNEKDEEGKYIIKYVKCDEESRLFKTYTTKDYGESTTNINDEDIIMLDSSHREDATLIEVVEELGEKANSYISELKIVEIPDDLDYMIDNYDGVETLHQKVQEW